MAQATERHQGAPSDAPARPFRGLHGHRTNHHRHPRVVDPGVRTGAVHHVGLGPVRSRDVETISGPPRGRFERPLASERLQGAQQGLAQNQVILFPLIS